MYKILTLNAISDVIHTQLNDLDARPRRRLCAFRVADGGICHHEVQAEIVHAYFTMRTRMTASDAVSALTTSSGIAESVSISV